MKKILLSNRLMLTPLTELDADSVYALYNNPEILKSYPSRPVNTKDDTIGFIKKITSNGNLVWGIRHQLDKNQIIGNCALHDWDKQNKSIEIGGALLPQFWGQGIMTEAFNLIIAFAIEELNVNTIIGKTLTSNKQAIRSVEKLGFNKFLVVEKETILRKEYA